MKIQLTGWRFTDAVQQMDCPKCHKKAGEQCRMPSGRLKDPPHGERVISLDLKFATSEPWKSGGYGADSGGERIRIANEKLHDLLREIPDEV